MEFIARPMGTSYVRVSNHGPVTAKNACVIVKVFYPGRDPREYEPYPVRLPSGLNGCITSVDIPSKGEALFNLLWDHRDASETLTLGFGISTKEGTRDYCALPELPSFRILGKDGSYHSANIVIGAYADGAEPKYTTVSVNRTPPSYHVYETLTKDEPSSRENRESLVLTAALLLEIAMIVFFS